jgi:hypothetical protein
MDMSAAYRAANPDSPAQAKIVRPLPCHQLFNEAHALYNEAIDDLHKEISRHAMAVVEELENLDPKKDEKQRLRSCLEQAAGDGLLHDAGQRQIYDRVRKRGLTEAALPAQHTVWKQLAPAPRCTLCPSDQPF